MDFSNHWILYPEKENKRIKQNEIIIAIPKNSVMVKDTHQRAKAFPQDRVLTRRFSQEWNWNLWKKKTDDWSLGQAWNWRLILNHLFFCCIVSLYYYFQSANNPSDRYLRLQNSGHPACASPVNVIKYIIYLYCYRNIQFLSLAIMGVLPLPASDFPILLSGVQQIGLDCISDCCSSIEEEDSSVHSHYCRSEPRK